jgi:hypothetical protein
MAVGPLVIGPLHSPPLFVVHLIERHYPSQGKKAKSFKEFYLTLPGCILVLSHLFTARSLFQTLLDEDSNV